MSNELRNAAAIVGGQLGEADDRLAAAQGDEAITLALEQLGQCRAELDAISAELGVESGPQTTAPRHAIAPLDFAQVKSSLKLASDVAAENFRMHLDALNGAHDDEQWMQAIAGLESARKAATHATQAYQAVLGSEDCTRKSVEYAVRGYDDLAKQEADAAGNRMALAAGDVASFGEYVPKSRFIQGALEKIARLDAVAAGVEHKVIMGAERFGQGLKAMGKRMGAFASMLRGLPSRIASRAEELGEPLARSASQSYRVFAGDVALGAKTAQIMAEGVMLRVVGAGFIALEKAMQARDVVNQRIEAAEVSIRAAAGVVSGAGRAIADSYAANKQRVEGEVAARRVTP